MKYFLAFILIFSVSACGFSPMYGKNAATNNQSIKSNLSQIDIDVIPNREGQFLRNLLIDHFYTNGYPASPKYRLSVAAVGENISDFDITISAEATRRQITLQTTMKLVNLDTNKPVLRRPLTAITSYNVLESEYSTIVTEQSAREAALGDLARQIEQQIVLYLNR